jgi:hypothetical protein
VALVKLGALDGRVDESSDETAAIGNHQLQSRCGSALVVAGAVVGVPHQHGRYGGVQAGGHEEGHAVLDLGELDPDVGDDGVADDGGDEGEEHHDATELEAIRDDGDGDGDDGGYGIGDDGPELGFIGGEAELNDDSRELRPVSVREGSRRGVDLRRDQRSIDPRECQSRLSHLATLRCRRLLS